MDVAVEMDEKAAKGLNASLQLVAVSRREKREGRRGGGEKVASLLL